MSLNTTTSSRWRWNVLKIVMRLSCPLATLLEPFDGAIAKTYLVSLQGIPLKRNEYVEKFSIDTWGVTMVAVCRFPIGWTMTVGSSVDPTGAMGGEASLGVTALDRRHLNQLKGLVLVRLSGPVVSQKQAEPNGGSPTFDGKARIGRYDGDSHRTVHLTERNVVLTPRRRCDG